MIQTDPTKRPRDTEDQRGRWSRMGFILAASGSAIGLGNIVFFPANAYRFGGGAFYLPYLIALFCVGIPLLALELALGHQERRAYPAALMAVAGKRGEFLGWWALVNTTFIALYYVAILGWVAGMLLGALGPLWQPETPLPGFSATSLPNPQGYFFHLLSSWGPMAFIAGIWTVNGWVVRQGTAGIERAVKIFVPAMWALMLLLAIRGVTLPSGAQGVWNLFAPDLGAMTTAAVWQGAFSQIFFTLSIGFGVMTAYGSYLPRGSDPGNNAVLVSSLNCGFEYIAGIAIFSILFAFSVVPQASTISMTFLVVPQGIGQLPGGPPVITSFGVLFFLLLLLAGLSSTVSMVESVVSALRDKFSGSRSKLVLGVCGLGALGSSLFALPQIVNPGLEDDGTLGLTLLDLLDHWAFSYGLLIVGLSQCLLLGKKMRIRRIRKGINRNADRPLGRWYENLIGVVIPFVLAVILTASLLGEIRGGLYGAAYAENYSPEWAWLRWAAPGALALWLVLPATVAALLTRRPGAAGGSPP